jgi:hypothetical protein
MSMRLETGSFQLPPLTGTKFQIQIDGATHAELLAVAQRRQRKPAADKPPAPPPIVTSKETVAFNKRPLHPQSPSSSSSPRLRSVPQGASRCRLILR